MQSRKNWTKFRSIGSLKMFLNINEFHDGYTATADVANGNEYNCINMRHFSIQFSIVIGLHEIDNSYPRKFVIVFVLYACFE